MTPYMDFPQLLAVLLKMLNEGTGAARKEIMKVRGGREQRCLCTLEGHRRRPGPPNTDQSAVPSLFALV